MDSKYPQIEQHSRRSLRKSLKQADPVILDECLKFLMDHPRTMSTGYVREIIWRYIPRYSLTETQLSTLQTIALQYLERPMSREFKWMCLTMARIADNQFWVKVKALLDSDNPITQINAFCLYAYSKGVLAGERQRLKLQNETHQPMRDPEKLKRLMPMFGYQGEDDFYRFIVDAENWVNGEVVYQTPREVELPILYFYGDYDHLGKKLASLDIHQCLPNVLLPKLAKVMSLGSLSMTSAKTIWLYTIYLLEKIDDSRAVPILIEFLEQKVDWKFETVTKWLMYRATLNVFLHYQTPEALQAIQDRPEQARILSEEATGGYGWLLKKIS